MQFNGPTLATISIFLISAAVATPVLTRGFIRRGTGVKYESNFLIQRAPQLAVFINVVLIVMAFLGSNKLVDIPFFTSPLMTLTEREPNGALAIVSWLGVALMASGMVFMIGGWHSLGECFSTDAEVLNNQTVRTDGMLKFVMHPVYSGIIQGVLGAALAATSPAATLMLLGVTAPLWLNRAKYEEKLLTETLGEKYKEYAENLRWRRLVPRIFPIGV